MEDRIDRLHSKQPGLQPLSRAHRNRLLPISKHFRPKSDKSDFGAPRSGFTP